MRKLSAERRSQLAQAHPDAAIEAAHIAWSFISLRLRVGSNMVAIYYPVRDELSTLHLAQMIWDAGHSVCLPVVDQTTKTLAFLKWPQGSALAPGPFGVPQPHTDALEVRPCAVVTPLLAFDRTGARLGYGGGYYDRKLAALRETGSLLAIGFAFAEQEVPRVPVEPKDQRLDYIATEQGIIEAAGG